MNFTILNDKFPFAEKDLTHYENTEKNDFGRKSSASFEMHKELKHHNMFWFYEVVENA